MLRKRIDDNARKNTCNGATQTDNRSKSCRNEKQNHNSPNKLSLSVLSQKPQQTDSRFKKMIQNPAISDKTQPQVNLQNRLFVAILIIKTTPNSVERRSGFVQRSFHCALRCAMCETKTYMLGADICL